MMGSKCNDRSERDDEPGTELRCSLDILSRRREPGPETSALRRTRETDGECYEKRKPHRAQRQGHLLAKTRMFGSFLTNKQ
jgi:hypothetical protein